MDKQTLSKSIAKLLGQRNIFLGLSVMLSITVAIQSAMLLTKNHRTVIVPTSGPSFWIENSASSSNYIEQMGTYLSNLLLNRSPADVKWRNTQILKHVHPSFFHTVRAQLIQDKDNVISQDQAYIFQPEKSLVDNETHSFIIEGQSLVLIGKTDFSCADQSKRRYTLGFKTQNGKLLLTSLKKEIIND